MEAARSFADICKDSPLPLVADIHFDYRLALEAIAAGADGLMIEVHNDPAKAKCDGAQSLTPDQFDELMGFIRKEVEFFGKKMN